MRRARVLTSVLMVAAAMLPGQTTAAPTARPTVEPGLLDVAAPVDVLVRFEARIPDLAAVEGLTVHHRFASVPAIYATATPAAVQALAARADLAYLERDKPVAFDLNSATQASRAADVHDPDVDPSTPPLRDADGAIIDGSGVGIAIVDTGLDGFHPDYQAPGKVGGNWIVTPAGLVPSTYSAGTQGHGTHVAGIAAGLGTASGSFYRGVAPGATLYNFGFGAGTTVFPSIAFDWILQHGAAQDPPIRIVNNSWHCADVSNCNTLNPDLLHVRLARMLVEDGVVVTWAAGNRGGDGYITATSVETHEPSFLSVGNYNDADLGTRDGCIYGQSGSGGGSSRGSALQPHTWPDLIAPGAAVTSTWAMTYDQTDGYAEQQPRLPAAGPYGGANNYRVMGGTSMAAPHVAGVVAMMLQARATLTPAQIEYLLKATASKLTCGGYEYPRADPTHPYDGANYVHGHGLIDARAAVEQALAFTGIPAAPDVEPLPESFLKVRVGIEETHPLFLTSDGGLSSTPPAEQLAAPRIALSETPVVFGSAPFTEDVTVDGFELSLWLGSGGESPFGSLNSAFNLISTLARADAGGSTTTVASHRVRLRGTFTAAPMHRSWVVATDGPVTFRAGERAVYTIKLTTVGSNTLIPEVPLFIYASETTPSGVLMGTAAFPVPPDTFEGCQVRHDCARIGGEVSLSSFGCDDAAVGVRWHGPPGSMAWAQCWDAVAVCVVAGQPGDPWGDCEAQSLTEPFDDEYAATCGYRMPDGARGGRGRCFSVVPLLGGGDR